VTEQSYHQHPSPNHGSRRGTKVDIIVLHHTGSSSGAGDLKHLSTKLSGVSAHYLVDRDGKVYQLVPEDRAAWHAGICHFKGEPANVNVRSVGIEIANLGDGKEPYTEAQYEALELLVPAVAQRHGVPLEHLVGHKEVAYPPGRKTDPSDNFDMARIRRAHAAALQSVA
jgi:N-acetylmuramoyl-L-alanine amidase